ncbi:MAG: DUF2341 domain-containing protein [Candidatus Nanopusillus sp.]
MKLLRILIFGLIIILISFLNNVYSLSGWLYYRPILINNTQNSNNLIDYQILVTLDTRTLISQGKMRSDCGDIRFTDSDFTTLLNYWIEPNTCNTANTRIWVKISFIPRSSTKTIYLWYGNPSATSISNPYNTLLLYEDWSSGSLAGWSKYGCAGYSGSIDYNDGNPPPSLIISGNDYNCDVFYYKVINKPVGVGLRIIADNKGYHGYYTFNPPKKYYVCNTLGNCEGVGVGGPNDVWTYNDQRIFNSAFVQSLSTVWVGFGLDDVWIADWNQYAKFDNIRVMLYTHPEPSVIVGSEHTAVIISSIRINPSSSPLICRGTRTSATVTANLNNPNNISTIVSFSCSAPSGITCSVSPSSCTTSGSSCSTTLYVNSSLTIPPGSYSVTVTASILGSSASATYTYNIGPNISISSQSSSNFQSSYNIYITGCAQNYTLYVNNSPYCYGLYSQFQNINALCVVSYPGSYSVYAQGCYGGTCVNSNTINLNIPASGITVPIIGINVLNITSQNIYVTISVNGSNQNIQSINVYYNNNNVYSNSNVNTNYYSFNLQLPYSNNGNITVCSTLTNGQSGCVTQIFSVNVAQTYIYYGIIQLQAKVQPININTTYGPIGNRFEFSIDHPGYILTLNITNVGNMTLNNITINLQQLGNVLEILYNGIPIRLLNNINIDQLQPNQSYILQFSVLPLYMGSSSLLLNFNVNGQNIGNAQYNLIVKGPSNKSSLIVSESINYILILLGIIGLIIFLI